MLDQMDIEILRALQNDGRLSNAELSRRISLSPPATHARVRQLEQRGFIRQYTALLDHARMGYDMLCFISVAMQVHRPEQIDAFRQHMQDMDEVLECFQVTGEYDYILKVIIRNRNDLQEFLVNRLTPIPGVARINTSLALAEVKSSSSIPVP